MSRYQDNARCESVRSPPAWQTGTAETSSLLTTDSGEILPLQISVIFYAVHVPGMSVVAPAYVCGDLDFDIMVNE